MRTHAALVSSSLLLVTALAFALAPLWAIVHAQWTGIAMYRHGYLLAAMASWLAWRSLRVPAPTALGPPSWWYLLPLGAGLAALAAFEVLYLNVPRVFLLPPLLVFSVGLVFGHAVAVRLLWPVLLLYGALPAWSLINGSLQSLTTTVVSTALALTGVPAFIEGNFVQLPAGVFEIAEDCSGLRYLVVATTLALFYGLAFLSTWRRRGTLLAVAAGTAIVCNWVRVYTVIVVGHLTDMQHYLVAVDHTTFGWVLFAAFLLPVLWLARRLEIPHVVDAEVVHQSISAGRGMIAAAAIASLLLFLPRVVAITAASAGEADAAVQPLAVGKPVVHASAWRPTFVNAREEHVIFAARDAPVELYRAVYPRQDSTHRVIAYYNSFVPPSWRAVGERRLAVPLDGDTLGLIELEGYLEGRRRIVWAWYSVAGEPVTRPLEAKLFELKGLLRGRRDAAAVALSMECGVDCGAAREHLTSLLEELADPLGIR